MTRVVNVWEQTPREWFYCIRAVAMGATPVPLEVVPFKCAKLSLQDTGFRYQLAVSDSAMSKDVSAIRAARPDLPASGDRRSGIIVFNKNEIIASFIYPGVSEQPYRTVVRADHRGHGLARKMLGQFYREIPMVPELPPQLSNIAATKVHLGAIHDTIDWAVAARIPVTQRVKDAWAAGTEEAEILAKLSLAERAGGSRGRQEK